MGRASALALARGGYDLALVGRRRSPLDETAAEAARLGSSALAIPADVTKENEVRAAFAATVDRFGRLDLLFNNAGLSMPARAIEDVALDEWNAVIGANVTGAFLCTREAVRQFKAQQPQGGRIINNGSLSAHVPRVNSAAYTVSKHAISGLTKSTALDGRPFGIACGQIDIGNAETSMNPTAPSGALQPSGLRVAEPMIDADVVAQAVAYMSTLPLGANVLTLTVMATAMPYVGRG